MCVHRQLTGINYVNDQQRDDVSLYRLIQVIINDVIVDENMDGEVIFVSYDFAQLKIRIKITAREDR